MDRHRLLYTGLHQMWAKTSTPARTLSDVVRHRGKSSRKSNSRAPMLIPPPELSWYNRGLFQLMKTSGESMSVGKGKFCYAYRFRELGVICLHSMYSIFTLCYFIFIIKWGVFLFCFCFFLSCFLTCFYFHFMYFISCEAYNMHFLLFWLFLFLLINQNNRQIN